MAEAKANNITDTAAGATDGVRWMWIRAGWCRLTRGGCWSM